LPEFAGTIEVWRPDYDPARDARLIARRQRDPKQQKAPQFAGLSRFRRSIKNSPTKPRLLPASFRSKKHTKRGGSRGTSPSCRTFIASVVLP
jgi:hypothetical protein